MFKPSNFNANERPNPASGNETAPTVSNSISLAELATSLEALDLGTDENAVVVQCTQVSSSAGSREISGSADKQDPKKTLPVLSHKPRRYALQM